jgi:hypothetical protein
VTHRRRGLLAALAPLTVAAGMLAIGDTASADVADQMRPVKLRVSEGEDAWHPDNDFRLDWDRPGAGGQAFPIGASDYRVRDAAGNVVVSDTRLPENDVTISHIHVPAPGVYTADVWLETPGGESSPPASATLRFDDVRPGPARPLASAGWVAANTPTVLRIEHPEQPRPASGIRGYAVSVDDLPLCGRPDRCSEAETDLRGGIGDDRLSLGILSEGTHVVNVVAVSGSGMRSAETRTATVRIDATLPEVALAGVPRDWANGPVQLTATAADALSGMGAGGPSGPFTAIAIDGAAPKTEAGSAVTAKVSGSGAHDVAFYARDAAGNVADGGTQQMPSTAIVRIDEEAPRVAFARFQDPSEPERVEALVADPLSGPDPARGSIAVRPAGTRQQFQPLPTGVANGRLLAHWDSDLFPRGDYEFRATGYDTAGNSTVTDRRDTGARMVLANPLKAPTAIEAGFGGRRLVWHRCTRVGDRRRCRRQVIQPFAARPASRSLPYGHPMPFAGRLTSVSGSPLAGLPVKVIETFDSGADAAQRTTTVVTAADGSFQARLAAGPSRRVEAMFAGNRTLTRVTSAQVRLTVLSGVRLRTSGASARIGGAPVVFSGQVGDLDSSIPPGGRPVELQFRLPGAPWTEFRTVQTDARGRFRYPYAFTDDDSRGVRFQFRAYVPAQAGWPYEAAASRPAFVTGH